MDENILRKEEREFLITEIKSKELEVASYFLRGYLVIALRTKEYWPLIKWQRERCGLVLSTVNSKEHF